MDEPDVVDVVGTSRGRGFGERLLLLAVAYGLTTVVGGYLAYTYQEQARHNEHQAAMFASQKEEAVALFREVSDLMGERSYLMLRIQFGSKSTPFPEDYESRWDAYREVLHRWNATRFTRRAMLDAYFGLAVWQMEKDIHYKLRDVGILLEKGQRAGSFSEENLVAIEAGMNEVTEMIKAFNDHALAAILAGEIGRFRRDAETTDFARSSGEDRRRSE